MTIKNNIILVTGAAGYIGSHICAALLSEKYSVLAVDNLSNSSLEAIRRAERCGDGKIDFQQIDVGDRPALDRLLQAHSVDAVIHCAGLKIMSESVQQPLRYFHNNVSATVTLLQALQQHGVRNFVFSSSAAVYGAPAAVPIAETAALRASNPYSQSKLMAEQVLADLGAADSSWAIGVLRYFNPVGAHVSGIMGEASRTMANNLLPAMARVASGQQAMLPIFGGDYPTADGTGVRDYIHVTDVADAHIAALRYLFGNRRGFTVNLGTGRGYSVLEMLDAFEAVSVRRIPYEIRARRTADTASCYADPAQASRLLGWRASKGLADMCADHWRWHSQNPQGYGDN
ncbi:UDP-glucose 4-epimerase GalE [Collimonas fungivorans]|uniref:UDP-glucose 4-epimerase GalE n=1 Tax=Collimonas fungivorans TaxID=158899 RepID=UPI003FA3BC4C